MQMEMKFAQLAAVVAGSDGDDSLARGSADGKGHGRGDSLFADAVDHDFVGGVGSGLQLAFHSAAERGAEGIGGGGDEPFVFRADLAAASGDAAGKGSDRPADPCDGFGPAAGGGQAGSLGV